MGRDAGREWKERKLRVFVPAHAHLGDYISTGFKGYFAGPHSYVMDADGLCDAFLARLPVTNAERWRIGHFFRAPPAGYERTLRSGENTIEDPDLAAFYEKIARIVRLRAILKMNLWMDDTRMRVGPSEVLTRKE